MADVKPVEYVKIVAPTYPADVLNVITRNVYLALKALQHLEEAYVDDIVSLVKQWCGFKPRPGTIKNAFLQLEEVGVLVSEQKKIIAGKPAYTFKLTKYGEKLVSVLDEAIKLLTEAYYARYPRAKKTAPLKPCFPNKT